MSEKTLVICGYLSLAVCYKKMCRDVGRAHGGRAHEGRVVGRERCRERGAQRGRGVAR